MMNNTSKAWLAVGAMASAIGAAVVLTRRSRRGLGEAADPRGVREVAADAFINGDLTRGKQILDELPEEQRTVARCTRARQKRYIKGDGWKGWVQESTYRLYKPFVSDPMYGAGPKQHPYTNIDVRVEHIRGAAVEGSDADSATIIGDLGPTAKYPKGETRFLVHATQKRASHREALQAIGYDVIVPCANMPLSGRKRRRRSR